MLKIISISFGFFILMLGTAIANALVLMMMWGWYIAPFFSVPRLDIIHALGITWILGLFIVVPLPGSKEQKAQIEGVENPMMTLAINMMMKPLTGLIVGWLGTFLL